MRTKHEGLSSFGPGMSVLALHWVELPDKTRVHQVEMHTDSVEDEP